MSIKRTSVLLVTILSESLGLPRTEGSLMQHIENVELLNLVNTMPEAIKKQCIERKVKKGAIILNSGDVCQTIYILTSGTVQAVDESIYGVVYAFSNYPACDIFGEMEAIGGYEKYMLSIRATTDATLISMPKAAFIDWIRMDGRVIYVVSKMLTKKLWEASQSGRNRLFASALVQMMMYFTRDFKNVGEPYCCTKTRQQIADETGLSVKTINRNIKTLNEMGYVTLNKGHVYINREQNEKMLLYIADWPK